MATIIGKGSSAAKRVTCTKCTSIIEYTLNEVQEDYSTDYTGDKDYYKYIPCPCCGKQVIVKGY
jgi:hypothetical protein